MSKNISKIPYPHHLRHTFATKLVMKGMDTMLARQLIWHKSESSFTQYSKRALELSDMVQFVACQQDIYNELERGISRIEHRKAYEAGESWFRQISLAD